MVVYCMGGGGGGQWVTVSADNRISLSVNVCSVNPSSTQCMHRYPPALGPQWK